MGLTLLVGGLLALLGLGVPIAVTMVGVALLYAIIVSGTPPEIVAQRIVAGVNSFPILAVPLFLLAGNLMNAGGLTGRMVDFAMATVGRFRGGFAQVNIGTSVLMSGVSGAAVADAAALGSILIPAMKKSGYDAGFSAGVTASSAVVGPIIPPSIPMIVFASMASSSVSVGAMFLAGALPGLLIGLSLMVTTWALARRRPWPVVDPPPLRVVARTALAAILALVMPGIIIFGIITGIFTPTESAAIACVYVAIVGTAVFREFRWRQLPTVLLDTVLGSTTILIIVGAASSLGFSFTLEGFAQRLVGLLGGAVEQQWLVLAFIGIVLLVLGMFLEGLAIIVLVTPILLPLALSVGIDPVHLGTFMVLAVMIGTITPPVGVVMYLVSRIADITLPQFLRATAPFYIALFGVLLLVIVWPPLSTWLPTQLLTP